MRKLRINDSIAEDSLTAAGAETNPLQQLYTELKQSFDPSASNTAMQMLTRALNAEGRVSALIRIGLKMLGSVFDRGLSASVLRDIVWLLIIADVDLIFTDEWTFINKFSEYLSKCKNAVVYVPGSKQKFGVRAHDAYVDRGFSLLAKYAASLVFITGPANADDLFAEKVDYVHPVYVAPVLDDIHATSEPSVEGSVAPSVVPFAPDFHTLRYDIDAIMGVFPLEVAQFGISSKIAININKDSSSYDGCKSKSEIIAINGEFIKLTKVTSVRIGEVTSNFGTFALFILSPLPVSEETNKKLKADICRCFSELHSDRLASTSLNTMVHSSESLSLKLAMSDHELVFRKLKRNLDAGAFMAVESFANKDDAAISLVLGLTDFHGKLATIFSTSVVAHLKVDVAVTLSCSTVAGYGTIFPSMQFFELIGEEPNYYIFLNKTLKQINMQSRQISGTRLHISSAIYDKVNCYSEVEDLMSPIRAKGFRPAYASAVMRSGLMDMCMHGRRNDPSKEIGIYTSCKDILQAGEGRSVGYRMEYRVRYEQVFTLMQDLSKVIGLCSWIAYPSKSFFKLICQNLAWLTNEMSLEALNMPGLVDVYRTALVEVLTVECFFKGRLSKSIAPKSFLDFMLARYSESAVLSNIRFEREDLNAFIEKEKVVDSLSKLIEWDPTMSDPEKQSMYSIVQCFQADADESADLLLKVYCQYCSSLLSAPISGLSLQHSVLQPLTATICKLEHQYMDMAMVMIFTSAANVKLDLPYTLAFRVIHRELNNDPALYEALKRRLLDSRCDFLINWDGRKPLAYQVVNCSGEHFEIRRLDTVGRANSLNKLKRKLGAALVELGAQGVRVAWKEEELTRLVAAREQFVRCTGRVHGFWSMVATNYLYGFPVLRTIPQMKDAMRRLELKPVEYQRLRSLAAVWRPVHFTIEERRIYYLKFRIILAHEDEAHLLEILEVEGNILMEALMLRDRDTAREEYVPIAQSAPANGQVPNIVGAETAISASVPRESLQVALREILAPLLAEIISPVQHELAELRAIMTGIDGATFAEMLAMMKTMCLSNISASRPESAVTAIEVSAPADIYETPLSWMPEHVDTRPEDINDVEACADHSISPVQNDSAIHSAIVEHYGNLLFSGTEAVEWLSACGYRLGRVALLASIDRLLACQLLYEHEVPKMINAGGYSSYYSVCRDLKTAVTSFPVPIVLEALKKLKPRFTEAAAQKCLLKLDSAPPSGMWRCWWDYLLESSLLVQVGIADPRAKASKLLYTLH